MIVAQGNFRANGETLEMLPSARSWLSRMEDLMPLRQQVASATAILCVALVLGLAAVSVVTTRRGFEFQASKELSGLAGIVADRLDRGIASRLAQLSWVADVVGAVPALNTDSEQLAEILQLARQRIPNAAWVGLADWSGRLLGADGELQGVSVANEPWFQRGLTTAAAGAVGDGGLLGEHLAAPTILPRARYLDVSSPVLVDGALFGVVGVLISETFVETLRKATLDTLDPLQMISLEIAGPQGERLFGPPPNDGSSGERAISAAVPTARGDWVVVATQPTTVALRPADGLLHIIIGFGAIFAAIGVSVAAVIGQRVSQPLAEIAAEADRIGKDSEAMPRARGSVEIVRLSQALRDLVRRIGFAERRSKEAEARASIEAERHGRDIEDLRRLADTDPLTTLPNRRGFMAYGEEVLEHYGRYRRPFALLMVDIDRFKGVNDTYGHGAGDAVIAEVGRAIASEIRPLDKVARFGGEEFLVLIRETSDQDAVAVAERIRSRISMTPISAGDSTLWITVSIGVSMSTPLDRDLHAVIRRADFALYVAKKNGRNRVVAGVTDLAAPSRAEAA